MGGQDLLQRVIGLLSRHGYVYASKQLRPLTGLSDFYDYGPLGAELKRNLKNEWWKEMVTSREHIVGVESAAMHSNVIGSGASSESDVMPAQDRLHVRFPEIKPETNETPCLQPSLHEGTFSHFLNTLCLLNRRLPFGLAQIGPCFRSRPAQQTGQDKFIFNGVQVTEMTVQFFSTPKTATMWFDKWQRDRLLWWRKFSNLPSDFTGTDVKASGHVQTAEIQYNFPWGVDTIERISNYGSVPVEKLQADFKADVQGKDGRRSVTPHLIENSASLEGGLLAYLLDGHQQKKRADTRGSAVLRDITRLHLRLAPIKAIVLPIRGTTELKEVSTYLGKEFRKAGINHRCIVEVSPSLEKYYTMFDEMGVPFTILLNENTMKTGILRVRHRDTTLMQQMHITEVRDMIQRHLEAD